jgi:hypothetical protein
MQSATQLLGTIPTHRTRPGLGYQFSTSPTVPAPQRAPVREDGEAAQPFARHPSIVRRETPFYAGLTSKSPLRGGAARVR